VGVSSGENWPTAPPAPRPRPRGNATGPSRGPRPCRRPEPRHPTAPPWPCLRGRRRRRRKRAGTGPPSATAAGHPRRPFPNWSFGRTSKPRLGPALRFRWSVISTAATSGRNRNSERKIQRGMARSVMTFPSALRTHAADVATNLPVTPASAGSAHVGGSGRGHAPSRGLGRITGWPLRPSLAVLQGWYGRRQLPGALLRPSLFPQRPQLWIVIWIISGFDDGGPPALVECFVETRPR